MWNLPVLTRRGNLQMSLEQAPKYQEAQGHGWTVLKVEQHKVQEERTLQLCLMPMLRCFASLFLFLWMRCIITLSLSYLPKSFLGFLRRFAFCCNFSPAHLVFFHRAYTCHDVITVCNHIYGWFCIVCFLCCKVGPTFIMCKILL